MPTFYHTGLLHLYNFVQTPEDVAVIILLRLLHLRDEHCIAASIHSFFVLTSADIGHYYLTRHYFSILYDICITARVTRIYDSLQRCNRYGHTHSLFHHSSINAEANASSSFSIRCSIVSISFSKLCIFFSMRTTP